MLFFFNFLPLLRTRQCQTLEIMHSIHQTEGSHIAADLAHLTRLLFKAFADAKDRWKIDGATMKVGSGDIKIGCINLYRFFFFFRCIHIHIYNQIFIIYIYISDIALYACIL